MINCFFYSLFLFYFSLLNNRKAKFKNNGKKIEIITNLHFVSQLDIVELKFLVLHKTLKFGEVTVKIRIVVSIDMSFYFPVKRTFSRISEMKLFFSFFPLNPQFINFLF
jgi:hypothetical protein